MSEQPECPRPSTSRFATPSTGPLTRLVGRLGGLLRQGLTARQISASVATGVAVGTSPLVGTTTATCSLLVLCLRLNPLTTLSANYAVYPLQLLLIFPLASLGRTITGWPNLPFDPRDLGALVRTQGWRTIEPFLSTFGNAFIGWLFWAPIAFVISYGACRILLRRFSTTEARAP